MQHRYTHYGIRPHFNGRWELCEFGIFSTQHGKRKYSSATSLSYAKRDFAKQKAHAFYCGAFGFVKSDFIEAQPGEYTGELSTQ